MIVTVSGLSGLTKAYRSVLSAVGSRLISGASRWLEARLECGTKARAIASNPNTAMTRMIRLRDIVVLLLWVWFTTSFLLLKALSLQNPRSHAKGREVSFRIPYGGDRE